ncbi:MAG TPA: phospholipase domain-containing protein, partial [Chryseosolibacter sp.]|nr:phospholipase domain-containing protein [Chryseosolibacter sp.]
FVTIAEEMKSGFKEEDSRTSPVGLGYRVPMIIASPWSRGGWVNSEVCDVTSPIRFMEKFLSKKTGKKIEEPNISSWRRTICGDLTSVFRPYNGEKIDLPEWLDRNKYIQRIYNARFKALPNNYRAISPEEAQKLARNPSAVLPQQERGTKPSNALKYELYADGHVSGDGKNFIIRFRAAKDIFGEDACGSAFNVYAPGKYHNKATGKYEPVETWSFAVKAGAEVEYRWPIDSFEGGEYHLRVYGPNGFFREFRGNADHRIEVTCAPDKKGKKPTGILKIEVSNSGDRELKLRLLEDKYRKNNKDLSLKSGAKANLNVDTSTGQGWYDFSLLTSDENAFGVRLAGRLETGRDGVTDPAMA